MGIESDQLIYDYLSRVGDLAQTALPADRRMRLVAQLRNDIDRQRGAGDSPATVRRILGRLGSPAEVVGAAAAVPSLEKAPQPEVPPQAKAPADEEWWRLAEPQQPRHPLTPGDELAGLPGMTGGVTVPLQPAEEEPAEDTEEAEEDEEPEKPSAWRKLRRLRRRRPEAEVEAEAEAAAPRPGLLETLAALLLLAGGIIGYWPTLAVGWLIAYYSPKLSRREAKFATLTLPGLVAGTALVWLWGRFDHRWGDPIAEGHLDTAIGDSYWTVVRIAAIASAVFLLWRSRRAAR